MDLPISVGLAFTVGPRACPHRLPDTALRILPRLAASPLICPVAPGPGLLCPALGTKPLKKERAHILGLVCLQM